jgi:CheY-like chemotaxis protein
MPENSSIKLTIAFNDPDLDSEELEEQAQNLLAQMRDLDEIETVDRVLDPNPPEGNKAVGAILVGLLTAQVNKENAQKVMGFLFDRLGNKPIELEVEANGKKLKVKANSREELEAAIEAAQKFVAA